MTDKHARSKVGDADMTVVRDQDVARLQVSVNIASQMHMLHSDTLTSLQLDCKNEMYQILTSSAIMVVM